MFALFALTYNPLT